MKRIGFISMAILALWLGSAGAGHGATLYVDQANGTGVEDGTAANPFRLIQTALNGAATGDVISVSTGTYQENLQVRAAVTLDAQAAGTTITAQSAGSPVITINVNGVTVNGFTITGASSSSGISLGEYKRTTGHRITGNVIRNNSNGIYAWMTSGDTIENNKISANSTGILFYYDGAGNRIAGNDFTGNGKAMNFSLFSGGNTVTENNFTENGTALYMGNRDPGNLIYHNNFIRNSTHVTDYSSAPVFWENGYAAGGNYWDDWTGPDSNGDGVVDQPRARDFFPVTEPNGWTKIVPEKAVVNRTSGAAYASLGEALGRAAAGDVVEAADGTITGHGMYYDNLSCAVPVTLTSQAGGATLFARNYTVPAITVNTNGVTVNGFTITGASSSSGISLGEYKRTTGHRITGNVIRSNSNGIYAWMTSGDTIENNKISANSTGILFYYDGANSRIAGNQFTGNGKAMNFSLFSGGNTVTENNFTENTTALYMGNRDPGNLIYHNNFVRNSSHVIDYSSAPVFWENGYAAGGNYWDDWTGPDSNGDGVVDQPRARDFFPVTEPNGWTKIVPEKAVANRTSGLAYAAIGEALAEAKPGDVIEAADGTITGHGMYYDNLSCAVPVTLTSQAGGATLFARNYTVPAITVNTNGVTVNGFTITGASSSSGISLGEYKGTTGHRITGNVVKNNSNGIYAWVTSGDTIESNKIAGNSTGILFYYDGANNRIAGNEFTGNGKAMNFSLFSGGNTVTENNFTDNSTALLMANRDPGNKIYHNNFIRNATQVTDYSSAAVIWDDGYPSGGNHWSNWTEPDVFSGAGQDETGGDGIVDKAYLKDRYPFVKLSGWVPQNTPPKAVAGPDQRIFAGETALLDGSASWDTEGPLQGFTWSFGDGSTYAETPAAAGDGAFDGKTPHLFATAGTYGVTLTVTDQNGATASDTLTVTVDSLDTALNKLGSLVSQFGLDHGPETALLAKLNAAQEALAQGDVAGAAAALQDFIDQISAKGFQKNFLPDGFIEAVLPAAQRILLLLR